MAQDVRDEAGSRLDETVARIRDTNDRAVEQARQRGEAALEAYERLLKTIADGLEAAGGRTADWLEAFTQAQARFTRELADALPEAARQAFERAQQVATQASQQFRRVPGEPQAEGEVRGAVAREEDLPIKNYDRLTASQVIERLGKLSEPDLRKIDAYERKHANRKTVHDRIASLTS